MFLCLSGTVALGWLGAGGCASTSPKGDRTSTYTAVPGTPTRTFTRTRTPTQTAPPGTPTDTPCAGVVPCNPTPPGSPTSTPWAGSGTIPVSWTTYGCAEVPFYEQTIAASGFQFSTGSIVPSNGSTDDMHLHRSGTVFAFLHNAMSGTGAIDMGSVALSDPIMNDPPDPATNTYSGCCSVAGLVGHSYFVRLTNMTWAKFYIECLDFSATGTAPAVRFAWAYGQ